MLSCRARARVCETVHHLHSFAPSTLGVVLSFSHPPITLFTPPPNHRPHAIPFFFLFFSFWPFLPPALQNLDNWATLAICALLVRQSVPICSDTGRVLLQTTPGSIRGALDKSLRQASTLDGVLECRSDKCHFWTESPGVFVGNVHVRVRTDADEQVVLARVANLFAPLISHLTVQVQKDNWDATFVPPAHHGTSKLVVSFSSRVRTICLVCLAIGYFLPLCFRPLPPPAIASFCRPRSLARWP